MTDIAPITNPYVPDLTLTHEDFEACAKTLKCSVASIQAVAKVESSGGGFDAQGFPKTLFEGHYFSRLTKHIYDASHPTISYPKWTRKFYGKNSGAEHARLELAASLDLEMAYQSASWGMFQIMGNSWEELEYPSVFDFVDAMCLGAASQLDAFTRFVNYKKLSPSLQNLDWKKFARVYNGPGQVELYSTKLQSAYDDYSQ